MDYIEDQNRDWITSLVLLPSFFVYQYKLQLRQQSQLQMTRK